MKSIFAAFILFSLSLAVHAEDRLTNKGIEVDTSSETVAAVETKHAEPAAAAKKSEAAPEKPQNFVASLQDLISFHDKEMASLKKTLERWNAKVAGTAQRRQSLQQEVDALTQKADESQQQATKAAKNEVTRLKKQIARINKDIASVKKELKTQSKDLAVELREMSQETQQALKDVYQQVIAEVQKPQE